MYKKLGDYRPLLTFTRQLPETTYFVPIRIASQSVLALLSRHAIIDELNFPTKLNLVFGIKGSQGIKMSDCCPNQWFLTQ